MPITAKLCIISMRVAEYARHFIFLQPIIDMAIFWPHASRTSALFFRLPYRLWRYYHAASSLKQHDIDDAGRGRPFALLTYRRDFSTPSRSNDVVCCREIDLGRKLNDTGHSRRSARASLIISASYTEVRAYIVFTELEGRVNI